MCYGDILADILKNKGEGAIDFGNNYTQSKKRKRKEKVTDRWEEKSNYSIIFSLETLQFFSLPYLTIADMSLEKENPLFCDKG